MPVNKNILEQYCSIKEEIKDLEQMIAEREKQISLLQQEANSDTVKWVSADLGYGMVEIIGVAEQRAEIRLELLNIMVDKLRNFKEHLEDSVLEIDIFLNGICDSEVQRICRLRFVYGYGWVKVARCMGCGYSEDCCRQKIKRYLDKLEKSA